MLMSSITSEYILYFAFMCAHYSVVLIHFSFLTCMLCIRELEGLIFQCGLRTDELKEQVEQMQPDQPTWITPPSPPSQPTTPSALSVDVVTFTHPQVETASFYSVYGRDYYDSVSSVGKL